MPIQISYEPSAAVIAQSALLGGQGQYAQWANEFLNNQYQFGTNTALNVAQMNQQRALAMQQMAAQAQQQASQQNFEQNMLPLRSALDAQNQAFQSNLQEGVQSRQSAQDFGEQQQLSAQQAQQQAQNEAAQIAQQQAGQLYNQQQMASYSEDQQAAQQFQADPLAEYKQNTAQAQQTGASYSQDQQTRMAAAKNNLSAIQNAIGGGQATLASSMPSIKQNMATLRMISASPDNAPPPTPIDQFNKNLVWIDPNNTQQPYSMSPGPGRIPMYAVPNGKGGIDFQAPRGYDPRASARAIGADGQVTGSKQRIAAANADKAEYSRNSQVDKDVRDEIGKWHQANIAHWYDPNYEAVKSQKEAEIRQRLQGNMPRSATTGVAQGGQQVTPQAPGGAPQQPPPPAGIPAQQPPQAQPQPAVRQIPAGQSPNEPEPSQPAIRNIGPGQPIGQNPADVHPLHNTPEMEMLRRIPPRPMDQLPERYRAVAQRYQQQGNKPAVDAIERMVTIAEIYGKQPLEKWPISVRHAYLELGMVAPDASF